MSAESPAKGTLSQGMVCQGGVTIYIYIYIIYIVTPPHEIPTLVLYRKYRVKPAFPAGPDSVSIKDYRNQAQISKERVSQLIQV